MTDTEPCVWVGGTGSTVKVYDVADKDIDLKDSAEEYEGFQDRIGAEPARTA